MARRVRAVVAEAVKSREYARLHYKLDFNPSRATLSINGREAVEVSARSFSRFANETLDAVKKVYGDLRHLGGDFREEYYGNGDVKVHLLPTGSLGVFDIYIEPTG